MQRFRKAARLTVDQTVKAKGAPEGVSGLRQRLMRPWLVQALLVVIAVVVTLFVLSLVVDQDQKPQGQPLPGGASADALRQMLLQPGDLPPGFSSSAQGYTPPDVAGYGKVANVYVNTEMRRAPTAGAIFMIESHVLQFPSEERAKAYFAPLRDKAAEPASDKVDPALPDFDIRGMTPLNLARVGDDFVALQDKMAASDPRVNVPLSRTFVALRRGLLIAVVVTAAPQEHPANEQVEQLVQKAAARLTATTTP